MQFFAVERWFDLEYFSSVECRARFFFVTCLREPLTRIASHLAKVGASVAEAHGVGVADSRRDDWERNSSGRQLLYEVATGT